jgi:hypothetical protein
LDRVSRGSASAYVALAGLVALAVVLGANLMAATRRSADAYSAYDALELTLETFAYTSPSEPVIVQIRVGNPTDQALAIESLDLRLSAGVHSVGGGVIRSATTIGAGESALLTIDAAIDDETYVAQLEGTPIEWIINGRVLVQLKHGEATWIPFATRYIS